MYKWLNVILLFLLCCQLGSCSSDKDDSEVSVYPPMPPGVQTSEFITANPGDEIQITAQLADVHGLKRVTLSSATLSLDYSIDLENKIIYLLDYKWQIPENVELGSEHTISIVTEGCTETVTKEILFLASQATDYDLMYVAYDGEKQQDWDNALFGFPRVAERIAPYTYSIDLYSPQPSTQVKFLPEPNLSAEGGVVTLPEEGYYHIEFKSTQVAAINKLVPTKSTFDYIYIVGSLTESNWDLKEENCMQVMYEANPYLLRQNINFTSASEGDFAFCSSDWMDIWRPLKECSTWSEIKLWKIDDGDGTVENIWWKAPMGTYEITFDYFLNRATAVKR